MWARGLYAPVIPIRKTNFYQIRILEDYMKGRKTIFYKSFHTALLFLTVLFVAMFGACGGNKADSTPENSEEENNGLTLPLFHLNGTADLHVDEKIAFDNVNIK